MKLLCRVRPSATPWTAAYQAPPSMGFSRQEYWSGVPLPSPLYPLVLWNSYNQIPLAFKVGFPGDSRPLCGIPRLRSLMWGLEPSQQWENFFATICLQFLGHPPGRYGNLILLLLCPSYHLAIASLSLDVQYLFMVVLASSCQRLLNMQFWCSCRRRWVDILSTCSRAKRLWILLVSFTVI